MLRSPNWTLVKCAYSFLHNDHKQSVTRRTICEIINLVTSGSLFLVVTTLQLALIRTRVGALPHFAAVGTASHLLAHTLADRSWISSTRSVTQRGVSALGCDCSVVFPLNFQGGVWQIISWNTFENIGWSPVVHLIGQKQLLHCLVLRNFLNTWLLILTTDLY